MVPRYRFLEYISSAKKKKQHLFIIYDDLQLHLYLFYSFIGLSEEPQCQITYRRAYAPSENSDQPADSLSLVRIFTGAFWIAKDAKFFCFFFCCCFFSQTATEDGSDCAKAQIHLFFGRTCQKVRFHTLRPI